MTRKFRNKKFLFRVLFSKCRTEFKLVQWYENSIALERVKINCKMLFYENYIRWIYKCKRYSFKTSKNKYFFAKSCNIRKSRQEFCRCRMEDREERGRQLLLGQWRENWWSTSTESALFEGVCAEIVQVEGCATRRAHREPGPLSTLIILALLSAHSLNRVCY